LEGTFIWERRGLFFASSPPVDFAKLDIASTDPWLAVAAVLERAKGGDFAPLRFLPPMVRLGAPRLFLRACTELLGNVATSIARQGLLELLQSPDIDVRVEACAGACISGDLVLVSAVLVARRTVPRLALREEISLMLSLMLEEKAGPVHTAAYRTHDEYDALVTERVEQVTEQVGGLSVPVWNGQPFGVGRLARRLLDKLHAPPLSLSVAKANVRQFRSRFEPATGRDFSVCFHNGQVQPLAAESVAESFLEAREAADYKDGSRYFWRNPLSE
jgi:hypothetical protein